jgi:hypothetical protein
MENDLMQEQVAGSARSPVHEGWHTTWRLGAGLLLRLCPVGISCEYYVTRSWSNPKNRQSHMYCIREQDYSDAV